MNPELRPYRASDQDALVDLWERCALTRPWNDPVRDIERKVAHDAANLLLYEECGHLLGSVMVGYDGHRGWINYLAVDPEHRRRGLGRLLMHEAEQRLRALGCAKINLQVRVTNDEALAFYRDLGFRVDDTVSMGLRLEIDTP